MSGMPIGGWQTVDLGRYDTRIRGSLNVHKFPFRERTPLVSKQAAVASVVFVDVQTMLLDNLGRSSQCCCDGRIANVW
jgi:hypothetical protein